MINLIIIANSGTQIINNRCRSMVRIARIVSHGYLDHIAQRGNRRQETFFCGDDYRQYIDLMATRFSRCGVDN